MILTIIQKNVVEYTELVGTYNSVLGYISFTVISVKWGKRGDTRHRDTRSEKWYTSNFLVTYTPVDPGLILT